MELCEYLEQIPLLSSPWLGETLYMYLAASNLTITSVLIREENNKQLPIYYVSKVMNGPELRYANIEK